MDQDRCFREKLADPYATYHQVENWKFMTWSLKMTLTSQEHEVTQSIKSLHNTTIISFFLFLEIYLIERWVTEKSERKRRSSTLPPTGSLMGGGTVDQARMQPGARNFFRISSMNSMGLTTWSIFHLLSQAAEKDRAGWQRKQLELKRVSILDAVITGNGLSC